jgi:hypothetical protein
MKFEKHKSEPLYSEGMPGYVLRDWDVIDYECYRLECTDLWFRGPPPDTLTPGKYFSAIGAAQTFGCFAPRPYPALLEETLGLTALNLGYSGAGPAFFTRQEQLLEYVNRGAFCIVQVMSGRSSGNSLFRNPEGLAHGFRAGDGEPATAESIFDLLFQREFERIPLPRRLRTRILRRSGIPLPSVRRVVRETRDNWTREFQTLMSLITVPKILFWFSERSPSYAAKYHSRSALLGEFPHLVESQMLDSIRPLADCFVNCISKRGKPQPLINRFTGAPVSVDLRSDRKPLADGSGLSASLYQGIWSTNPYYPTPEMHQDAVLSLEAACKRLLDVHG